MRWCGGRRHMCSNACLNLKAVFSLGAGVDAILADKTLPDVPIVRIVDPDMTMRMSEFVVMHVLMHHRQQKRIDENQRAKMWDSFATHAASALSVGIMGFGVLGQDAGEKLKNMGFQVAGWSQSKKQVPGIDTYRRQRPSSTHFLRAATFSSCFCRTRPRRRIIIDRELIRKLSRKGPFGAPILINAGRGKLQMEKRYHRMPGSGATLCRIARRVRGGAAAAGQRAVDASQGVCELACGGRFRSGDHLTEHPQADKAHEAGGALENIVDRRRGY